MEDIESVKMNIMEVLNSQSKEEMSQEEEREDKKFEMDFDLTKISNHVNFNF